MCKSFQKLCTILGSLVLITFLDSASLKMVNINFSSTHGHCSRKYNEMKNDFLSMTRPFFGKIAVSGFFSWSHFLQSGTLKTRNFDILFISSVSYCDVNVRQIPDTLVSPSG